jgi:cysteine desulfurase
MIYLDHNATTPLLEAARDAMVEALDLFGNASSAYACGRTARAALESARRTIADVTGVEPREVIFTSGGTESDNTAVFGSVDPAAGDEIVLAALEHSAVVEPARELERRGARLRWLGMDSHGRIDPAELEFAIGRNTALVTVAWANNEIGTVQDVEAIAAVCRDKGVPFHTDAVQAFGKIGSKLPSADLISITAHKVGGPKGIGALIRRGVVPLRPMLFGGSQERALRPGTENVAAACGFAAAASIAGSRGPWSPELRDRLWDGLSDIPGAIRYSAADGCLPNTLLVGFEGIRGESIVAALDLERVAVSVGSACAAGSGEPSHVLQALGYEDEKARGGVRFSTGFATTRHEVDEVVTIVHRVVGRVRSVAKRAVAGARS